MLHLLVQEEKLRGLSLLLLVNKSEQEGCMSLGFVNELLDT